MKIICFAVFLVLILPASVPRPSPDSWPSDHEFHFLDDGVNIFDEGERPRNAIRMNEETGNSVQDEHCEQMYYGVLPCSRTSLGHVFLIFVYESLLFHAESYVAGGGERIFQIIGPGVLGTYAFQIIGSLPESLILLGSGLLSSEEDAQEFLLTGVGLLAGSSILLVTIVWGTCAFFASQDFNISVDSSDQTTHNILERLFLSLWPGTGVVTDSETKYTARLMLVSLIPFVIIQIPGQFVGISLFISVTFLISYFLYQLCEPWIKKRQLLYLKHGYLLAKTLNQLQKHTVGWVLYGDGAPNVSVIKSIFKEPDQEGDKLVTFSQIRKFIQKIKFRKVQSRNHEGYVDQLTEDIDTDHDQRIGIDEFAKGMEKWMQTNEESSSKPNIIKEVLQPWIKKKKEREMLLTLTPIILDHLQTSMNGSLSNIDGTPDTSIMRRLFKDIDRDHNDFISYSELKDLLDNTGIENHNTDALTSAFMEEFDISGDQLISEDEFVMGLSQWITETSTSSILIPDVETDQIPLLDESNGLNYDQEQWEQTEKLVKDKHEDQPLIAWMKAISLVMIGLIMLGLLAEPLIHSVQNLSKSAKIPSSFIAFTIVPIATNLRISVKAIKEARHKKSTLTSLMFSELYGTVLMNNLLGFTVLLSLVLFRGLSWNFSTEILMVLIVCAAIGCLASISCIVPLWTSIFACMLYPFSLVLVTFLGDSNWFAHMLEY